MRDLFKNRNYILVLLGNFVSRIGSSLYNIAISWWIVNQVGGTKSIAYVYAFFSIGNLIIMPIGGVLADKFSPKSIMVVMDLFSGITCLSISICVSKGVHNLFIYVFASMLLGIYSGFFKTASKAITPLVLEKKDIVKGNSLFNSFGEAAKIIGPGLASVILYINNAISLLILINGLSFILSAISELFISITEKSQDKKAGASVGQSIKEGFKFVFNFKVIVISLVCVSVINFFLSSFDVLIPAFVTDIIHGNEVSYSNIMLAFSIGAIVCTWIVATADIDLSPKVLCGAILCIGITLTAFSFCSNIFLAYISVFVLGATQVFYNTVFYSYIQMTVDNQYLGRVFSLLFFVSGIFLPLANVVYGYWGEVSVTTPILLSGICVCVAAVIYYLFMRNKCRNASEISDS